MNKIKAVVIEDELPASRLLCSNLSRLRPDWEIESLPGTIEDSVAWFASHPHPDILFLDIQLTDGNSFMFIEQAHPRSFIVFTTAYDTYAVKAFEVNTVDWASKKQNDRSNTMAMINAFMISLSNNLNISGTAKELMQNYIPAIAVTMYDGYYIYAPTYTPITEENTDGVQLFYNETTRFSYNKFRKWKSFI